MSFHKAIEFLKQILSKLLKETDLVNIFGRISGIPKLGMLREGLKLFVSHFLLRNIQTQETEHAKVLRDRAEVATKAMEAQDAKIKLWSCCTQKCVHNASDSKKKNI